MPNLSKKILALGSLVTLLVFLTVSNTGAAPLTQTFTASADSYVQENTPSTNFGTATQVRVDGSPLVVSGTVLSTSEWTLLPVTEQIILPAKVRSRRS
ncbi:MAG: hypothetical protein NUV69_00805 [Candidatus Curtissbacteria bacterium]|nr:hypothetical protein [Candidatus Curtissbacteria bacterium]